MDQSTTASIPAIKEQWPFDWQDREHKDKVMGLVKAKARWVTMQDVEGEDTGWLTEGGWLDDWNGEGGKQLEAFVDGIDGKWTAQHVSGKTVGCTSTVAKMKRSGDSRSTMVQDTSSDVLLFDPRMVVNTPRLSLCMILMCETRYGAAITGPKSAVSACVSQTSFLP